MIRPSPVGGGRYHAGPLAGMVRRHGTADIWVDVGRLARGLCLGLRVRHGKLLRGAAVSGRPDVFPIPIDEIPARFFSLFSGQGPTLGVRRPHPGGGKQVALCIAARPSGSERRRSASPIVVGHEPNHEVLEQWDGKGCPSMARTPNHPLLDQFVSDRSEGGDLPAENSCDVPRPVRSRA